MNHPSYPFTHDEAALQFDFESISEQAIIQKRVIYSPTGVADLYNLALVDIAPDGSLDDSIQSGNDDLPEVVATVIQTLFVVFKAYPKSGVYFRGSDSKGIRIRLYRAIIGRDIDNVQELFDIYGLYSSTSAELFEPNKPYVAFIIKPKS